jgi:hypothetical protein
VGAADLARRENRRLNIFTTNLGSRSSNLFGRAKLPPLRTKLRTLHTGVIAIGESRQVTATPHVIGDLRGIRMTVGRPVLQPGQVAGALCLEAL